MSTTTMSTTTTTTIDIGPGGVGAYGRVVVETPDSFSARAFAEYATALHCSAALTDPSEWGHFVEVYGLKGDIDYVLRETSIPHEVVTADGAGDIPDYWQRRTRVAARWAEQVSRMAERAAKDAREQCERWALVVRFGEDRSYRCSTCDTVSTFKDADRVAEHIVRDRYLSWQCEDCA